MSCGQSSCGGLLLGQWGLLLGLLQDNVKTSHSEQFWRVSAPGVCQWNKRETDNIWRQRWWRIRCWSRSREVVGQEQPHPTCECRVHSLSGHTG